ncbi:hypothetical protein BJV82DRAFT_707840 [Fennellomyces sp. T-0311]|nr:hypothetical protein BJV82DRAFT_707840 [Fennellomyces sp. T-0311]
MVTWRFVNFSSTQGAGSRVDHSVVFLENSNYMFVLFGFDQQGQAHTGIQILYTSTYQWIEGYHGPGPLPADEKSDRDNSADSTYGLSRRAIAGIVVGIAAGGGLIVGILFFLRRRKRHKNYEQGNFDNGSPLYSSEIKSSPYEPPHTHDNKLSFPYLSSTNLSPHQTIGTSQSTPLSSTGLPAPEEIAYHVALCRIYKVRIWKYKPDIRSRERFVQ